MNRKQLIDDEQFLKGNKYIYECLARGVVVSACAWVCECGRMLTKVFEVFVWGMDQKIDCGCFIAVVSTGSHYEYGKE